MDELKDEPDASPPLNMGTEIEINTRLTSSLYRKRPTHHKTRTQIINKNTNFMTRLPQSNEYKLDMRKEMSTKKLKINSLIIENWYSGTNSE